MRIGRFYAALSSSVSTTVQVRKNGAAVAVEVGGGAIALSKGSPNPASSDVSFTLDLPSDAVVDWTIYDLRGRLKPGRNVLAVLVMHYGVGTFQSLPTRGGLLAQVRQLAQERLAGGPTFAWIEALRDETRPMLDSAGVGAPGTFLGELMSLLLRQEMAYPL